MKVTVCSSLSFVDDIKKIAERLKGLCHTVFLPETAEMILRGELTLRQIDKEKGLEGSALLTCISRKSGSLMLYSL